MQAIHSSKHSRFYARNKQGHHKTDYLNHLLDPFASSEEQIEALIGSWTELTCIQVPPFLPCLPETSESHLQVNLETLIYFNNLYKPTAQW